MAEDIAFQTSVSTFTVELRVLLSCISAKWIGFFLICGVFFKFPWPFKGAVEQQSQPNRTACWHTRQLCFPHLPCPQSFPLPTLVLMYTDGKPARPPKTPRNCFWCVSFQLENKLHWLTVETDKRASMGGGGKGVLPVEGRNKTILFWQQ